MQGGSDRIRNPGHNDEAGLIRNGLFPETDSRNKTTQILRKKKVYNKMLSLY